jgi:hypothetical protein
MRHVSARIGRAGVSAAGLRLLSGPTLLTFAPLAWRGGLGRRAGAAIVAPYAVAAVLVLTGGA